MDNRSEVSEHVVAFATHHGSFVFSNHQELGVSQFKNPQNCTINILNFAELFETILPFVEGPIQGYGSLSELTFTLR